MWWMTVALAGTPLVDAWNLQDRGCHEDVLALAGEALAEDPGNPGWHRLRESALQRHDPRHYGEHTAALDRYAEAHPDHRGLRVARVAAALWDRELDCDHVGGLLDGLTFGDEASRYEVLRLRISHADRCDAPQEDKDALRDDLRGLKTVPMATSLALQWDLAADPKGVSVEQLTEQLKVYPARADRYASILWGKPKGPGALRKAVLDAAERWVDSDVAYELHVAPRILKSAGKKVPEGLEERLQGVLPCTVTRDAQVELPDRAWRGTVYEADKRPTHAAALASLMALADDVPEPPIDRVYWLSKVQERHAHLGHTEEVYVLEREIARLTPEDGEAVNNWAYAAAVRGEDMEEALGLLEAALEARAFPVFDPASKQRFDSFRSGARRELSNWEDTHGWLLHRLDRDAEAAEALDRALFARPSGVVHAHAGLVHAGLGDDARAFAHLSEAFTEGIGEEPLREEARVVLESLALAFGAWHPEGVAAWIDALDDEDSVDEDVEKDGPETHALIGETFPIAEAEGLGGGQVAILGNEASATVIDVWATWCGPCVAGMPHLQEVAEAYEEKGVKIVGLSVDENKGVAKRFYKGAEVSYDLAWFGDDGFKAMKITGIPSLFVLDGDGVVVRKITGYASGDTRLEEALDEVLGETKATD